MKKILLITVLNIILLFTCGYFLSLSKNHLVISDGPFMFKKNSNKPNNSQFREAKIINNMNIANASILTDVLEVQTGTMSAYGPDCNGCSGHLGGGYDASGGNYTYNDTTFGEVRIVAGDPKYPYGTIVRVKNSKIGEFKAIVLDRGGAIGIGRRFMFDLLFPTEVEAAGFGTSYNLEFEILRYGY